MEHDYSDEEIAHIPISDSHETTAPVEALGSEALCPIKVKVTPDGSYDVYTVQNGDYVDDIAYRCETTRHGLLTHNPQITQSTDAYERSITGDQIYVGEELRLPDIYESSGHSVFSITDNPFQSVSSQLEKREDTMFYLQQSPLGIFFRSVANMVGL